MSFITEHERYSSKRVYSYMSDPKFQQALAYLEVVGFDVDGDLPGHLYTNNYSNHQALSTSLLEPSICMEANVHFLFSVLPSCS
jgi:hypothetical protein